MQSAGVMGGIVQFVGFSEDGGYYLWVLLVIVLLVRRVNSPDVCFIFPKENN